MGEKLHHDGLKNDPFELERILATKVFHTLTVYPQQTSGGRFAALSPSQSCGKQSGFQAPDLSVQVRASVREQDSLLGCKTMSNQPGREIAGADFFSANCDDNALDQILKFTDVAWPTVLLKYSESIGSEPFYRNAIGYAVNLQEIIAEQRDVPRALS
jgi:hypothetical protein